MFLLQWICIYNFFLQQNLEVLQIRMFYKFLGKKITDFSLLNDTKHSAFSWSENMKETQPWSLFRWIRLQIDDTTNFTAGLMDVNKTV